MVRVSTRAVSALEAMGDLEYGGAGSPTGYVNVALASLGAAFTWWQTFGPNPDNDAIDGSDATVADSDGVSMGAGSWAKVSLLAPKRIGRFLFRQGAVGSGYATDYELQSSTDNATWTTRATMAGQIEAGVLTDLASPITARYWRVLASAGVFGGAAWHVRSFELYEVTTVGAGNPTRLAPPAGRRVLTYDPDSGVPAWPAPQAANPDTAGATLATLETEVNELKAALRASGILAS